MLSGERQAEHMAALDAMGRRYRERMAGCLMTTPIAEEQLEDMQLEEMQLAPSDTVTEAVDTFVGSVDGHTVEL